MASLSSCASRGGFLVLPTCHGVPSTIAPPASLSLRVRASSSSSSSSSSTRDFVLKDFASRRALKIISGLQNFNQEKVAAVAIAAEQGGATHLDIACSPELVKMVLNLTNLPICVSSVDPEAFLTAIEAGAHMVEVGNYDSFYTSGRIFSALEVLDLAKRSRELLPSTVLSVTVPHTLNLDEQVQLAEMLESEGVDIIQTEGGTSSYPEGAGIQGFIEKAVPTLAAAYSISRAVKIPVMCASGLSDVSTPLALAAGASGVGIGSAVNKLDDQISMVATVRRIADAIQAYSVQNMAGKRAGLRSELV